MATVFRKTYTQPLPRQWELVERRGRTMVMWFDRRGRRQYDDITTGKHGQTKIIRQSPTYFARYRDADGIERIQSTGCRDEQAARQVLADLVKRVEHRKAGIITPEQDRQASHASRPIKEHIATYLEHLTAKTVRGKKVSEHHRRNVKHQLGRVMDECGFHILADITREAMEKWMNAREAEGVSGRTRNTHRAAIVAFCNWCVDSDRLPVNPLARLYKADERTQPRRVRRALTEEEVAKLLTAARQRPVAELGRESIPRPPKKRRGRSTWNYAPLTWDRLDGAYQRGRMKLAGSPERLAKLELVGQARAAMYLVMVTTGLRKSEVASLTVGQLELNVPRPYAELLAKDEKSGRGAKLPLRADVVEELQDYLAALQRAHGRNALPHNRRLFHVPLDMIRIFDRDLAAADIPKTDARGRTVDLHCLRHTFGTHLARAGVAPRVAMAAMRHSSMELTMGVYTDPTLLDVAGAVDSLPAFEAEPAARPAARRA